MYLMMHYVCVCVCVCAGVQFAVQEEKRQKNERLQQLQVSHLVLVFLLLLFPGLLGLLAHIHRQPWTDHPTHTFTRRFYQKKQDISPSEQ